MKGPTLLAVDDLVIGFPRGQRWVRVVDRVSLEVAPGERVGLVGASGSGKSLTALAVLGLVPEPGARLGGMVRVNGVDPFSASAAELARIRGGEVGIVLQESTVALNPVYSVSFQLGEALRVHRRLGRAEALSEALRLLNRLRLEPAAAIARAYPHQLSGGQAQRVMLALALAGCWRTNPPPPSTSPPRPRCSTSSAAPVTRTASRCSWWVTTWRWWQA
jgi:ABC-type glutathione transport system ATPase component